MNPREVGNALVCLCREGRDIDAVTALYSDSIVSVKLNEHGAKCAETHGIDELRVTMIRRLENFEVHVASAEGPMVDGNQFSILYDFDVTPLHGPHAGKQRRIREVGVYTVAHGRIVREEFFH